MSRFFDLVNASARNMGGYSPGGPPRSSAQENRPPLIKLDSNENPFGPSPRAVAAMQLSLSSCNCYPDDNCNILQSRLAEHHGLPREQVLVTAGSTALLGILCQTLLAPGLNAITSERSFIVYSLAVQATGGSLIETPQKNDGFDLEAILSAVDENTRIIFLANPNNPTGTLLDVAAVDEFLARVPGHVVVVLDEAYYEFAMHFAALRGMSYSHSLDYVRQGASVVVLRTFSKAHGLAGLRVGYGLGPADLLAYCARMRNTFSVSSVAQTAAVAAIDDQSQIRRVVTNNSEQSGVLTQGLADLGFQPVTTWANFVYCDLGEDTLPVVGYLYDEGISVRPLRAWGAPTCIRVSIGTAEQNHAFLTAAWKLSSQSYSGRVAMRGD
jgi:histidinol-phosphate aminotransferase